MNEYLIAERGSRLRSRRSAPLVSDFMVVFSPMDGLRLCSEQRTSRQVQVRQGKRREGAHRVFHQPTVADLCKPPKRLHHVEGMLTTRACCRAAAVGFPLAFGQRTARPRTSIDAIAHTRVAAMLSMLLRPVRLIAEDLALLAMQQLIEPRDVTLRCRTG